MVASVGRTICDLVSCFFAPAGDAGVLETELCFADRELTVFMQNRISRLLPVGLVE